MNKIQPEAIPAGREAPDLGGVSGRSVTGRTKPIVVYADCKAALEEAWRLDLARDVPVRTIAPAILADPAIAAEPADAYLSPENIAAIEDALLAAANEIRERLLAEGDLEHADDIALVVARVFMAEFQNHVFCAAMLREEDFHQPVAVVAVRHDADDLRRRFYFGVTPILAAGSEPEVIEVSARRLGQLDEPTPPAPPFLIRLAHATSATVLYRLARAFWRRVPLTGPQGSLLVLRDNELLKEAAAELSCRGFALRKIDMPKPAAPAHRAGGHRVVEATARTVLEKHLDGRLAASAAAAAARLGGKLAAAYASRFLASLPGWRCELVRHLPYRPRAVLTNMVVTPEAAGLRYVLREKRIPLIEFQHGVTAEICERNARYFRALNNSSCDLAITFNEPMAEPYGKNANGGGRAVAVGLPRDYHRLKRKGAAKGPVSLWYVRTTIYQSNLGRLHRGLCDRDIYTREVALIDRVLARLDYRVVYKPYPAIRYLDDDPVLEHAARQPNIEVYADRLDLRYVIGAAHILVTKGATSTVSWCLMSDRPTVLIDSPDCMPLRAEVRDAFRAGLFLFDGSVPDFHERLLAFLSQPIEAIDVQWAQRAEARKVLVHTYLSTAHAGAGAGAADAIMQYLAEPSGR